MKAYFAEATKSQKNDCDLQIIIKFESDDEKLLAKKFLQYDDKKHAFRLFGYTSNSSTPGFDSMNFGFSTKE